LSIGTQIMNSVTVTVVLNSVCGDREKRLNASSIWFLFWQWFLTCQQGKQWWKKFLLRNF